MWETIRALSAEGRTVVLTTHYLEEADALADRVAVIHKGRLVADGTTAEVKALVGGARIAIVTTLDDTEITALVAPRALNREGGITHLDVAEATPALQALLAADASLVVVSVSGVGLDDAFLSLTADDEVAA
jgi:ABC-2 type transport system ATP-binding protein